MLPYEDLMEVDHPFNGVPISSLKLEKIEAYEDLTVGEAKALFEKGQRIIPLKQGDNIVTAILPSKFLQLIILKKLALTDAAKKTQTKDFVIVPSTLDCAQLERYHMVNLESLRDIRQYWWRPDRITKSLSFT
jgi:hypothetical protein